MSVSQQSGSCYKRDQQMGIAFDQMLWKLLV